MSIKVGLIGAIGVDDIGDVIMLQEAIRTIRQQGLEISRDIDFTIFSLDCIKAEEQIKLIDVKAQVVPALREDNLIGGLLSANCSFESLRNDIEQLNRIDKRYYDAMLNCDLLFFVGGGYFNEYWGSRLWPAFIIPIAIAEHHATPVFISGVTIGPFAEQTIQKLHSLFKRCHSIILRDHSRSSLMLDKLGGCNGNVLLGCDDISPLWGTDRVGQSSAIPDGSKYAVIHLFHWMEKLATDEKAIYQILADVIDEVLDGRDLQYIVFMPFNHFRNAMKGGDYIHGERLMTYISKKDGFILLEPTSDYLLMRRIIRDAEFLIAGRYHPVVFSLAENTPALGIYVNDLYQQKLQGAYEVLGIDQDKHTFFIDELDKSRIMNWHKENVIFNSFPKVNLKKIVEYRNTREKFIKRFLTCSENEGTV